MKHLAILTFQSSNNYGALLQCYALSKTLMDHGVKVSIINLKKEHIKEVSKLPFLSRNKFIAKHWFLNTLFQSNFAAFRKEHFSEILTKPIQKQEALVRYKNTFDAVVVGSDQVWRGDYTQELQKSFFLDFVGDTTLKVSYAASFGLDQFEGYRDNEKEIANLIARFDAVSVREDSGVVICKNDFGVDATHVLDPVFLLDNSAYSKLINADDSKDSQKYMAYYFLNPDSFRKNIVASAMQKHGLSHEKNIYTNDKFSFRRPSLNLKKFKFRTFSSFLSVIKHADFIVTDSFHGLAFSIIFNKQFLCVANSKRGASRMESILQLLGLKHRLISEGDTSFDLEAIDAIDYAEVNQKIQHLKKHSLQFLVESLQLKSN